MDLKALIRDVPDFPQPGILFRDITPLLGNTEGLRKALDGMVGLASDMHPECIVGIESRGFIFGVPMADRLGLPFVPVRKPGKLPAARMTVEYSLEYGESRLDIHEDAMSAGSRALIVDDLLATGGTALAAAKLVEMVGGVVAGFTFAIELEALAGRKKLDGYPVESLLRFG
ncbi:MAG: adenine phosphoribosyltransferase [Dehalococcoidia bacterium]